MFLLIFLYEVFQIHKFFWGLDFPLPLAVVMVIAGAAALIYDFLVIGLLVSVINNLAIKTK